MEQQAETLTAVHGCACLVLCSCTSFSRCTRRWQERLPRQAYPGVLRAAASHGLYSFSRFNQIIESVKKRQMFLSFGNRHHCCLEPFWIGMYLALFYRYKALVTQHEDSVFLVQQTLTFWPFLGSPQNYIQNFQNPKAWSEVTANEWLLYLVQWDFSGFLQFLELFFADGGSIYFSKRNFYTHTIHVWYIYLHLVDFYGKCR